MPIAHLQFEVHCQSPQWTDFLHIKYKNNDNRYQIYIDDEMLVERSWRWYSNIFFLESMFIDCENDKSYKLKLVTHTLDGPGPRLPSNLVNFIISNFRIVNVPATNENVNDSEINFILR